MFTLPIYVGIDYHTHILQVCIMNQQRKILAKQLAHFCAVCPRNHSTGGKTSTDCRFPHPPFHFTEHLVQSDV